MTFKGFKISIKHIFFLLISCIIFISGCKDASVDIVGISSTKGDASQINIIYNLTNDDRLQIDKVRIMIDTLNPPKFIINEDKPEQDAGLLEFSTKPLKPNTTYHCQIEIEFRNPNTKKAVSNIREFIAFYTFTLGNPTSNSYSIPSVQTFSPTSITSNSAACGGYVAADGGVVVSIRGVCYSSVRNNPGLLLDPFTLNGGGTGSFTSPLTGLTPGTKYYYRAYATNSKGTAYGNVDSFTTSGGATLASVTTTMATGITATSANSGGIVTADGGAPVTQKGVCYGTSPNPNVSGTKTIDGSSTGSFTSSLTSLLSGTTYYYRAYATNSVGTAYGTEFNFTTSSGATLGSVTTTGDANSPFCHSRDVSGNVTSLGSGTFIERGIVWSTTSTTPTELDNKIVNAGSGIGSYTDRLTVSGPNLTVYYRAYIKTTAGTEYGTTNNYKSTTIVGCSFGGGEVAFIYDASTPGYTPGTQQGYSLHTMALGPVDFGTATGTGENIGDGILNTANATLVANSPAIALCANLVAGGHSDWFLPSKGDINASLSCVSCWSGGPMDNFWSSSENPSNTTEAFKHSQAFSGGYMPKITMNYVHCLRKW